MKTKPTLVRVGDHLINPDDVTAIRRASKKPKYKGLFVIDRRTQSDYPLFVEEKELEILLNHFTIEEVD